MTSLKNGILYLPMLSHLTHESVTNVQKKEKKKNQEEGKYISLSVFSITLSTPALQVAVLIAQVDNLRLGGVSTHHRPLYYWMQHSNAHEKPDSLD